MDSTVLIPKVLHLQKNGYELRIVRNLTDVVIEAENSETSQLYSKILSDAEIKQFDNIFYNTPAAFHKILKEGFEGGHDHIEATIDEQALITLITKFQVAGKDRQAIIHIQLAEKQLDPMKECERVLMKLDEQRPDERGNSEKQFLSLFKRMFRNQQMLVNRVEEIGQNGVNKSIVLKDKKYDGIETLEERLKKIEEQIEEINEVVSDGLVKADHDIVDLKKNVELLKTEVHKKLESSLEKVIEETMELEKRQKRLENESGQGNQGNEFKQRIEVVESRMDRFEKLNNLIADTQVKAMSFNNSIEELQNRLKHFEASHEDFERKIKKAVENPERETRGESSVSDAKLDVINKSIEELVSKVKAISGSARSEEALQNERYNEFIKVSADTEKKLVLIKENFVKVEHRLKSLEEEAPKTDKLNNRFADPEEVKIEGNRKDIPVKLGESIISRVEEPVFRKDRSKPGLEIQAKFNPNFFDGDLKFTNENRALESPPGITIDRTLLAKNPLPKTGKYCISIKYGNLVKNANGLFAIGVAVESIKDTGNILAPGCFFITPFEKVAYINCVDINYPSANLKVDDVICMIIDREDNLIAFEIAGKVVIEDRLNPDFFENQDLYPCIFIYQCSNVKISFI